MIIDCVGCLHGNYPKLEGGDLLIFTGDLTARDTKEEHIQFSTWLSLQNYKHKIVIAGNHDVLLQKEEMLTESLFNTTYLCDSGTEFEALKIWGSPWTKTFPGMNPKCKAFTVDTEEELAEKWALIPEDIDILITHGPPLSVFDRVKNHETGKTENVGSLSLCSIIGSKNIKLHAFSHIHEGYGTQTPFNTYKPGFVDVAETIFVNCSHVNERYQPVNKPIRVIL